MAHSELSIKRDGNRIYIQGALDLHHFQQAKEVFKEAHLENNKATVIDLSKVTALILLAHLSCTMLPNNT